jgi:prolipoprotein diacylglyceryltransferase
LKREEPSLSSFLRANANATMFQVLFRIPTPGWLPDGIPIYGFGMMLFLAFVICTWLSGRLAEKEGISKVHIQDLAIWLFVAGIIGARLTFLIVEGMAWPPQQLLWQFFRIWDGGLVFYGSMIGGVVGYVLAYHFVIRKHGISNWKLADVIAPSIALGLALGRIGCFLNGCCYGNVACPDCRFQAHFPLSSPARFVLVHEGLQTPAGFTMDDQAEDDRTVGVVDPASDAAAKGLQAGDLIVGAIVEVNRQPTHRPIENFRDLQDLLVREWPRGENKLVLEVKRGNEDITLPAIYPRTIGLHPTQIYSSIGAFIIFLLLLAYYPLKRRDGEVMALLMLTYPVERFLEEALRNDTPPMALFPGWPAMTVSQYGSQILFVGGLLLTAILQIRPVQYPRAVEKKSL